MPLKHLSFTVAVLLAVPAFAGPAAERATVLLQEVNAEGLLEVAERADSPLDFSLLELMAGVVQPIEAALVRAKLEEKKSQLAAVAMAREVPIEAAALRPRPIPVPSGGLPNPVPVRSYMVNVSNFTEMGFLTEVVAFYNSAGVTSGLGWDNVPRFEARTFELGPCPALMSYSIGAIVNGTLIGRIPDKTQPMFGGSCNENTTNCGPETETGIGEITPAWMQATRSDDFDTCVDSWGFWP
jgi:hypothetical protein